MRKILFSKSLLGLATVVLAFAVAGPAGADKAADARVAKGKYLATIMDCVGCHTDGYLAGRADASRYLAGSTIGFGSPAGIVYPPNLTPHKEHGLGSWSDEEIIRAVRSGLRPDGRVLAPIMPWPNYAVMTDEDARALVAYLRSIEPNDFNPPDPVPAGEPAPGPYMTVIVPEPADGPE